MPKKAADKKEKKIEPTPAEETPKIGDKIIEIDEEEAVVDDELVEGEDELALEEEDELGLDEEEVDPFKDKWEE